MSKPQPRPALAGIGGPMAAVPELLQPGMRRLCSNESPLGPSERAIAAAAAAAVRGHEYPEGEGGELVAALAARFGVPAGAYQSWVPGSDTLMLNAVLAFAGPGDEVVFSAARLCPLCAQRGDRRGNASGGAGCGFPRRS